LFLRSYPGGAPPPPATPTGRYPVPGSEPAVGLRNEIPTCPGRAIPSRRGSRLSDGGMADQVPRPLRWRRSHHISVGSIWLWTPSPRKTRKTVRTLRGKCVLSDHELDGRKTTA